MISDDDSLVQFMNIAGVDDLETARHFLEACNWNIENAVNLFFANQSSNSTSSSSSQQQQRQEHRAQIEEEQVRSPIEFEETATRLYDFPQTGAYGSHFPGMFGQSRMSPQRVESTFSTVPHLRDIFTMPADILCHGSFNHAKSTATISEKWLLVYLHDESVFACHELIRDVWRDETVQNLVLCYFTLWQAERNTEAGQQFIRLYGITDYEEYPIIAIIDPRTGQMLKKFNGRMDKNTLIDQLQTFPETNPFNEDNVMLPQPIPNQRNVSIPTTSNQFDDMDDEQMLEAAIRASIEEAERNKGIAQDTTGISASISASTGSSTSQPVIMDNEVKEHEEMEEEVPQFTLPEVNVDQYLLKEGGTRIKLVTGAKSSVHRVALNTPLAALYRLAERELEEKKPFKLLFAGKEIDPSLTKTLESENMRNASFNVAFE